MRSRRYCTQATTKKKKKYTYDYNIQELWDTIKRPNLGIHREEETEIQTQGIRNIFNEIISENFSTLCNDINIYVQEAF
jgi:hypothetical protein